MENYQKELLRVLKFNAQKLKEELDNKAENVSPEYLLDLAIRINNLADKFSK